MPRSKITPPGEVKRKYSAPSAPRIIQSAQTDRQRTRTALPVKD